MNEELSDLISELREHVLYLRELGVGHLDAELPEFDFPAQTGIQIQGSKTPVSSTEYVVPKISIIPETPTKVELPRANASDSSNLSRLLSLSSSDRTGNVPIEEYQPPKIKPEAGPAKISSDENVLFDIRQKLPDANETVAEIQAEIGNCQRCDLCSTRKNIAHSTGNLNAELMFIGEAPGADEDIQGKPFVGKAGQLLTKIIEAIGMKRDDVFIGNINRCRPPGNRQPTPIESAACKPYLLREIAVVKPKVIVVLGNTACQNLLGSRVGITKLRGEFHDYFGVKVMPTFHPAFLLRDATKKRETWDDMKKVREFLKGS